MKQPTNWSRIALIASVVVLVIGVLLVASAGLELAPYACIGAVFGGVMAMPLLLTRQGPVLFMFLWSSILGFLILTQPPHVSAGFMMGFFLGVSVIGLALMSKRWRKEAARIPVVSE